MYEGAKKYWLITLVLFDCVFLPWFCGFIWFGQKINDYMEYNEEHTDAIAVLTGGRNRIAEAIKLFNNQMADHLFISGVEKNTSLRDITQKLKLKINNPVKVELGHKATNTIENAIEIKEWIEKNNIHSVRLVTSNYHVPRSLSELESLNLSLKIIAHPVYSEKVARHWWQSWGTFKLILGEYNKYLVVIIRNMFK